MHHLKSQIFMTPSHSWPVRPRNCSLNLKKPATAPLYDSSTRIKEQFLCIHSSTYTWPFLRRPKRKIVAATRTIIFSARMPKHVKGVWEKPEKLINKQMSSCCCLQQRYLISFACFNASASSEGIRSSNMHMSCSNLASTAFKSACLNSCSICSSLASCCARFDLWMAATRGLQNNNCNRWLSTLGWPSWKISCCDTGIIYSSKKQPSLQNQNCPEARNSSHIGRWDLRLQAMLQIAVQIARFELREQALWCSLKLTCWANLLKLFHEVEKHTCCLMLCCCLLEAVGFAHRRRQRIEILLQSL